MDPILVTTVEKEISDIPLLIIDYKGIVGSAMYKIINQEIVTAFVSSKQPAVTEMTSNLIYIPYKHHIPEIPNGKYSIIIFVSDDEKDLGEITKKCIAKAKEDAIPFIFIINQKSLEVHHLELIEKIIDLYDEAYVLVLGEFFGQGDTLLDSYILQAGTTRSVKLPQMGLRKTRPVLFADAIHGILQILFGIQKRRKITFLYPHHEYTDLSIAHMLQKIDPLIHVDFLKEEKKHSIGKAFDGSFHAGHYFFDKDYPIQEKLIDVYNTISSKRKTENDSYVYKEEMKPLIDLNDRGGFLSESAKKWRGTYLLYIFIFLFFPILCLGISALIAVGSLHAAKAAVEKGDIPSVMQQVAIVHASFAFDNVIKLPLLFELKTIGFPGVAQQLDNKITTGRELTNAINNLFTSEEVIKKIIHGESRTPDTDIAIVVSTVRSSLISLQNITTKDTDEKELITEIGKYQQGIDILTGTVGLLPHILATDGKHTYLVLFQNNMELRPGGGFIGSYGLVTFDHGKMSDFTVHDIYNADRKLHKHVDPPFAIRRYMGTVHQYLRDSNFDPDFVLNAQKATDMLQLEMGQKVDGVMTVDLTFVKYLLSVTGPLSIPEQHVSVNADNLFLLSEEHAEKDPTGGIVKKDGFLTNVLSALKDNLQSEKQINISTLIQKSLQGIQEKHMLFALANIIDQNQLTVNNISSSLWDTRPQNTGTINDYLGINEANIGVNNANYFMQRQIKQSVSIDGEGSLKGAVHLTYTNTSQPNQWPGGDYKNYLRIIVPKDTVLTGVSFDGQEQATRSAITDPLLYESKAFKAPSGLEIEQIQEFGKTLYGFLVTIPAGSKKTVDIMYEHAQKINLSNPVLHYSLYLYKQPGTNNDPFSLSFNFPLAYSILSSSPTNGDGNSDFTLDTLVSGDKVINVDLTKK